MTLYGIDVKELGARTKHDTIVLILLLKVMFTLTPNLHLLRRVNLLSGQILETLNPSEMVKRMFFIPNA